MDSSSAVKTSPSSQHPDSRMMAGPSISTLRGVTSTTSKNELLRRTSFFRDFFRTWLKLDITTLAAAVMIFGTISGLLTSFKSTSLKLYEWFTKFCTASILIPGNDRLNKEVLNWIAAKVLVRQRTRILTARTQSIQTHTSYWTTLRNDYTHENRIWIQYLPSFGMTWFVHDRKLFLVRRMTMTSTLRAKEYNSAPRDDEPLLVMCIGRSVAPIKRFLETCRDYGELQRSTFITVRSSREIGSPVWDTTILRPIRALETLHFDEGIKLEIVTDLENYLDPDTRKFYTTRGIPYRRGYLLHGPPGTGKTSLCLALAGHFDLELYSVHIPSVRGDGHLDKMFADLPPRCLVLLEDIDAVGINRSLGNHRVNEENQEVKEGMCTLAGLLNVLDGVASQEGRLVVMTSNHADRLEKALLRPGRIDKIIGLGKISQKSSELMFFRMYRRDKTDPSTINLELKDGELEKLASLFSSQIPEDTLTPAQLQGFLLNHRDNPHAAAAGASVWVNEEKNRVAERKKQDTETAHTQQEKDIDNGICSFPIFPEGKPGVISQESLQAMIQALTLKFDGVSIAAGEEKVTGGQEKVEDNTKLKQEHSKDGEARKEPKVIAENEAVIAEAGVEKAENGEAEEMTTDITGVANKASDDNEDFLGTSGLDL